VTTAPDRVRFGVWANVYGTFASLAHPDDPVDASWARNRDLVLEAERLGFEATLVAQHTFNPHGDQYDQLEAWTASAALAALTSRIEVIAAIKPLLAHPVVLAKQALQIEEIAQGRFSLNFVNAWYRPELDKAGIDFLPHAERYAYGREWITVVRSLMEGRRTTFAGRYLNVDDYVLRPADAFRPRPLIYGGGESEDSRAVLSELADVFFLNAQPPEDAAAMIDDLRRRPRGGQPPLRYAMAAFVIARETDEEAQAALRHALALAQADQDALASIRAGTDPASSMGRSLAARGPVVGTNGGTAAGLVGSYATVARRLREFADLGVELFMLQFQPFEAEMRRFAEHVRPLFDGR